MSTDVIRDKCGWVRLRGMATVVAGTGICYNNVISHRTVQCLLRNGRIFDDLAAAQAEAARLTSEYCGYHVNAVIDAVSREFVGYIVSPDGMGKG